MAPSFCTSMAEYNRWMNSRLFDAAAKLTETQLFEDRGAFFGSLFETLNHIVAADLIWLHRFARQDGLLEIGHVLHGLLSLYNTWAASGAAPQLLFPCAVQGAKGNQEYFVLLKLGQALPPAGQYEAMARCAMAEVSA